MDPKRDRPGGDDSAAAGLGRIARQTDQWARRINAFVRQPFPSLAVACVEDEFGRAVAIRRALADSTPENDHYRAALANNQTNLGTVFQRQGRLDEAARSMEAETTFREAIANLDELAKKHPQNAAYTVQLGSAYARLASILSGQPEKVLVSARKAIATLTADPQLADRDPSLKPVLVTAHWTAAEALAELGKHQESLSEWEAALSLAPEDRRDPLRLGKAEALAHLGKHAQAAAEAKDLAPATRGVGQPSYRLAAVFALASAAAAKDAALASGERDRLSAQYAASAISLLEQAKAAGHFKAAAERKALRDDPSIQSLRSRPEFPKWLSTVEAGSP